MSTSDSLRPLAKLIDAAWLTRRMSERQPRVVTSAQIVEVIHGTSTKVRVAIGDNDAGLPSRVIVKSGCEQHSSGKFAMHLNEMRAYRDLIPTFDQTIETPACFFAGTDEEGRPTLVLEDLGLRDVRFLNLLEPLDFDTAARFLDRIARLHARWWNAPDLSGERFSWVARPGAGHVAAYARKLLRPDSFAAYVQLPRAATVPMAVRNASRIEAGLLRLAEGYAGLPQTICHGDTHLGNLYLTAAGEPGFLDWIPRLAPWCQDVSYFITAALDWPNRRVWEGALLQHYFSRLRAYGVEPPSFEAGWVDYRRDLVWGLFIWMLNSSRFQSETNNTAATMRFAIAVSDHDSLGLLGA